MCDSTSGLEILDACVCTCMMPLAVTAVKLQAVHQLFIMFIHVTVRENMSHIMRKLAFCICKNKDTDQLCSNCTAEQRLCFRFTDSTIFLLLLSKISSICHCTGTFVSDRVVRLSCVATHIDIDLCGVGENEGGDSANCTYLLVHEKTCLFQTCAKRYLYQQRCA